MSNVKQLLFDIHNTFFFCFDTMQFYKNPTNIINAKVVYVCVLCKFVTLLRLILNAFNEI